MPVRWGHCLATSNGIVLSLVVGCARATSPDVVASSNPIDSRPTAKRATTTPRPIGASRAASIEPAPPPLDLSATLIRKAIADSRDPLDDVVIPRGAAFGAGGATPQAGIDQGFKRAEIPTCVTPAAYTFDPPQIGPLGFGGFLALPYLVHAIITGKCRH